MDDFSKLDAVVTRIETALDRLDRDGGAALARIEMALDAGALRFALPPLVLAVWRESDLQFHSVLIVLLNAHLFSRLHLYVAPVPHTSASACQITALAFWVALCVCADQVCVCVCVCGLNVLAGHWPPLRQQHLD